MSQTMRRREFITLLGGAAAAWPVVAEAQQRPTVPVVGFLGDQIFETRRDRVGFFLGGLAEAGFIPGRNVVIDYRWAEGQNERLLPLARQLVQRKVSVIAAVGSAAQAQAAMAATDTIPIVFGIGGDPVEMGLVESLARPGKNVTGSTVLSHEVIPKRFQIMHELLPAAKTVAFLANPTSPKQTEVEIQQAQFAARTLALRLLILGAKSRDDFEQDFTSLVSDGVQALVLSDDPLFVAYRDHIAALAARHAMPTMYHYSERGQSRWTD